MVPCFCVLSTRGASRETRKRTAGFAWAFLAGDLWPRTLNGRGPSALVHIPNWAGESVPTDPEAQRPRGSSQRWFGCIKNLKPGTSCPAEMSDVVMQHASSGDAKRPLVLAYFFLSLVVNGCGSRHQGCAQSPWTGASGHQWENLKSQHPMRLGGVCQGKVCLFLHPRK